MTKEKMKHIIMLDSLIAEGEYKLENVQSLANKLEHEGTTGRLQVGASSVVIENPALLKCLVDITSVSFKIQLARLEKELEEL